MQYLQVKTYNIGEIQRIEKKVKKRFWKRHEIKYSIQKIIDEGIADGKHYNISPYPRGECYAFLLMVEGSNQDVLGFMVNFGNKCRIYKTFTMGDEVGKRDHSMFAQALECGRELTPFDPGLFWKFKEWEAVMFRNTIIDLPLRRVEAIDDRAMVLVMVLQYPF